MAGVFTDPLRARRRARRRPAVRGETTGRGGARRYRSGARLMQERGDIRARRYRGARGSRRHAAPARPTTRAASRPGPACAPGPRARLRRPDCPKWAFPISPSAHPPVKRHSPSALDGECRSPSALPRAAPRHPPATAHTLRLPFPPAAHTLRSLLASWLRCNIRPAARGVTPPPPTHPPTWSGGNALVSLPGYG